MWRLQVVVKLAMLDQSTSFGEAVQSTGKQRRRMSVPGCVILQAVLAMPQSACQSITDALADLSDTQMPYVAQDAAGSRVLEAFLKVGLSAFCM